jgi:hypothetical protein
MSPVKEPAYFSRAHVRDDIRRTLPYLKNEQAYLNLFAGATKSHRIIGESSTCYMRSESDLEELRAFAPNPKIVGLVRDPVTLVSSYYHFLRFQAWEPLSTLREAWDIQDERCNGRIVSATANRPDSLAYRNVALLGQQVDRLFRMFGRDNVKILLFDNICESPSAVGRELQSFLGLTYVEDIEMPRSNVARAARFEFVDALLKRGPETVQKAKNSIKRLFGVKSLGVRRLVEGLNSTRIQHSVDPDLRAEMQNYFRPDVSLLGELLGQDLFALWNWDNSERDRSVGIRTSIGDGQ